MSLRHSALTLSASILLLGPFLSNAAWAHAHLASQAPAANSVVGTSPPQLRLKFTEALELKFSGVSLKGPDGKAVPTGSPRLEAADAAMLLVPLDGTLSPGRYTVEWHATATDTHRTQGAYSFTVKP